MRSQLTTLPARFCIVFGVSHLAAKTDVHSTVHCSNKVWLDKAYIFLTALCMKIHGLTHLSAPILDRSDVFGNCFYGLLQGNVFIYVNSQIFALLDHRMELLNSIMKNKDK